MPLSATHATHALDDAQGIRQADAELLSLALIDARNVSLRWLALLEDAKLLAHDGGACAPLRRLAHAAWYQEWMVARNVQRQRGEAADALRPRLASIHPEADGWFDAGSEAPTPALLRAYMAQTLDATLELLAVAEPSDEALYVYRAALLHEDRLALALAEMALAEQWPVAVPAPASRVEREPIWMPAQRMQLGTPRQPGGGFVPENERWAHEVTLPKFEIDAQVVNWARYVPFAEDGGYDQRALWSDAGWQWLQDSARRAPRHVERLRGGAVLMRQGRLVQAPAQQAVVHVTRHEAEAWCRWAGRRLPTEPEWELAAAGASSRGFAWGDVFEWVAGTARTWPGHAPTPDALDRLPPPGAPTHGVLRGAAWLCRGGLRPVRGRRFAAMDNDIPAAGFRSCAL